MSCMDEPRWVLRARQAVVGLAAAGILACLYVALVLWRSWRDNPGWDAIVVDLGLLTLLSAPALWVALRGPRVLGMAAGGALLVWGAMGTWLYGFLWVPGAAALVGCLVPRPPRGDDGPRRAQPTA